MLEYWNAGIMGSGKIGYWLIGSLLLDTHPANVQK